MTTHRQIIDRLSSYLDGALDEPSRREVARHLETCPGCARELRRLKETVELVGSLPEVDPPQGFHADLMERLADRRRGGGVRLADRLRRVPDFYKGMALAAAFLIVALPVAQAILDSGGLPRLPGVQFKADRSHEVETPTADAEPGVSASPGLGRIGSGGGKLPPSIHDMTSDDAVQFGHSRERSPERGDRMAAPPLEVSAATGDVERRVIKESRLEVEVQDFEAACRRVAFLVESVGGYVQQSAVWTEDHPGDGTLRQGSFMLRAPADRFTDLRQQLADLGSLERAEDSGRDVTAEFYDTQARIRNLERQEARLLELLGQARTLDEILRVENELTRVRGEIEMLQGRLNYLSRLTEMATIHLQLREVLEVDEPDPASGLWGELKRAVLDAVSLLGSALRWLALAAAAALPFILALALVLVPLYWLYRRRRRDR